MFRSNIENKFNIFKNSKIFVILKYSENKFNIFKNFKTFIILKLDNCNLYFQSYLF